MRIVSEFHDYYDVVQGVAQDRSLTYVRTPSEEELGPYPFPYFPTYGWGWGAFSAWQIRQHTIGFCGKIYPCVEMSMHSGFEPETAFCYKLEDVDEFVERNFKPKFVEHYRKGYDHRSDYRKWPGDRRRNQFKKCFDDAEKVRDKFGHIFANNNSPIFVASVDRNHRTITFNACLRPYEFYRVKDPYTAFQELSIYFGNLAQPNKPIPAIPDETMASIKGFDKWSFRKEPSKKR